MDKVKADEINQTLSHKAYGNSGNFGKTSGGFAALLERFIVFVTGSSFIIGISSLLMPVLNNSEVEKILINWFTFLVLAVSGLIFILIQQIFAYEKIKPYLHIVACVFYIIFAVVMCGISGQMNQPYILIPFLAVLYFIENSLNNLFVFHDRFIEECGNLKGKELEAHLFHNNLSAIDFGAKARMAQGILTVLPFIIFLVLFPFLKSGHKVTFFSLAMIFFFFLGEFLIFFMMGLFKNDVFFGFLGFKDYIQNKRRLFKSALVIFLAAGIFALVISSNNALIKITIKERPLPEVKYEAQTQQPYVQSGDLDIREMLEAMYPDDGKFPAWIWDVIFGIIKWAAIIALVTGLIRFFFQPFFSAHWKSFWKEGRLIKILRHIFKEIKDFFKYAFTKAVPDKPYSSVESRSFQKSMMDFLKRTKRSKEKSAEIDRLTKHFMKLIDWGEAHDIKYRTNLAPAEYTALIFQNSKTVEIKAEVKTAGLLFEKALYDKEILTSEEEKQFIEAIEKVLKCE